MPVYMGWEEVAHGGQKRALNLLDLELLEDVSCPSWVLAQTSLLGEQYS